MLYSPQDEAGSIAMHQPLPEPAPPATRPGLTLYQRAILARAVQRQQHAAQKRRDAIQAAERQRRVNAIHRRRAHIAIICLSAVALAAAGSLLQGAF